MDAIVVLFQTLHQQKSFCASVLLVAGCALLAGCQGKSIKEDNPVFAAAPPRRTLVNKSTLAQSPDDETTSGSILQVSSSVPELTGNTVVATVNGTPIFVDDLVGSVRLALDAEPSLTHEKRQQILYQGVQAKLGKYIEQEVVLHALASKVPEDRQEVVKESLEQPFQEVLQNIRNARGVTTDAELNQHLAQEGLSVDLLRESFQRIQMVNGYVATLAETPDLIDRPDMLEYYHEHIDDYKTAERVRWQEIVILFSSHDGADGARQKMQEIQRELKAGADFGELAATHSSALSAERRGDLGWLERGGLTDKELEGMLFELPAGSTTKVFDRNDRLELYHVRDQQAAATTPFSEVQSDIEQQLRAMAQQESREKVMADLKAKAAISTIFDEKPVDRPPITEL